ncbi:YheC/YheD family endospore coat-associated protein [Halalkalibacter okhensis]|uniref:YheC/YheD family endospore coat-associated protein n=1 Tax=Halalkalibacter okhensis TaxID=333138 RepID=UPI00068FE39B|nr:YheC/YheD family protein [Halalkalibacter okhensis]
MRECPLIGILVTRKQSRKKVLKLYQHYNNKRCKLYSFTPTDILWKEKRIIGLHLVGNKWKESTFPFPMVVYNRCYNKKVEAIKSLESTIGKSKCFNHINHFNKWHLYNILKNSNLDSNIPATFLSNEVNIRELLEKYRLLYCKPSYGHKGKGVYRLELQKNGDIHISLYSILPAYICRNIEEIQPVIDKLLGNSEYIIQRGIQLNKLNSQYFDIRVLVQKDIKGQWAVTNMVSRIAYDLYYNTSMYETIYEASEVLQKLYSLDEKNGILESLCELSIEIATTIELQTGLLGELGIDFGLDEEKKLWIIEINGKPQKNIYQDLKGYRHKQLIYSRPVEYAYYLAQKSRG